MPTDNTPAFQIRFHVADVTLAQMLGQALTTITGTDWLSLVNYTTVPVALWDAVSRYRTLAPYRTERDASYADMAVAEGDDSDDERSAACERLEALAKKANKELYSNDGSLNIGVQADLYNDGAAAAKAVGNAASSLASGFATGLGVVVALVVVVVGVVIWRRA